MFAHCTNGIENQHPTKVLLPSQERFGLSGLFRYVCNLRGPRNFTILFFSFLDFFCEFINLLTQIHLICSSVQGKVTCFLSVSEQQDSQ